MTLRHYSMCFAGQSMTRPILVLPKRKQRLKESLKFVNKEEKMSVWLNQGSSMHKCICISQDDLGRRYKLHSHLCGMKLYIAAHE